MNQDFGGAAGNIPDDWPIPGVPGIEGSNDGIAAEIITYVDLPAGVTTMIFNSDDGFRTTTGWVRDEFRSQLAGEFVGGRGAADTAFDVYAETAGTYAFRTIWYEGNGGAALEWLTVDSGGNKVLLNGEGGLTTYRAITGVGPTVISSVTPGIGATGVFFDSPISATLTDGDAPVDAASVRISLDGVQTPATATKNNGVTTISFSPPDFLTPGQHTASITFTAGGQSRTETWSFTVGAYAVLTAAQQAVSANTSQPGFIWRVFQNEAVQHTTLAQTELALAGQLTQNGQPLENLANPDAAGANVTGRGVQDGPLIRFEMPGVINVSQWEGDMNGNFTPDEPMPGIPGMTGMNDGIDAEIITYLQLPAGVITMGVNSDDGFRTQAGYINVPADGIILGQFDGGRGATDTIFKFLVRDAGIYPFRTIWQEGGGGANIEWFTVKADGSKVLVNDRANGGIPAYRVGVAPDKPTESFLAIDAANGQIQITWDAAGATLERSINLIDWTAVTGATSPYSVPNPTGQGAEYFRLRQ
jgi:hypothetical protein